MHLTDLIEYVIMSIRRKKYNKLLQEVKYLRSELEYQEEVLSEYHLLFEKYYRTWCAQNNINIAKQEEKNSKRVQKILPKDITEKQTYEVDGTIKIEENEENKEGKKKFNKLYRKLAMELHPDKESGDEEKFAEITEAYEQGNWSVLLERAIEMGIEPSNMRELIPLLKEEIQEMKKIIEHNKGVYSWRFYECEDNEQCKEKIIKQFLKHLFKLEV